MLCKYLFNVEFSFTLAFGIKHDSILKGSPNIEGQIGQDFGQKNQHLRALERRSCPSRLEVNYAHMSMR